MNKKFFTTIWLVSSLCYAMDDISDKNESYFQVPNFKNGKSLTYDTKKDVFLLEEQDRFLVVANTLKLPPLESLNAYFTNTNIWFKSDNTLQAFHPLKGGGLGQSTLNSGINSGKNDEEQRIKKMVVRINPGIEINYVTGYFQGLGGQTAKEILAFRSGVVKGMVDVLQENFDVFNQRLGVTLDNDLTILLNNLIIANNASQKAIKAQEFLYYLMGTSGKALGDPILKVMGIYGTKNLLKKSVTRALTSFKEIIKSEGTIITEAINGCEKILQNITNASAKDLVAYSEQFACHCNKVLEYMPKTKELQTIVGDLIKEQSKVTTNLVNTGHQITKGTTNVPNGINWKEVSKDVGLNILGYISGRATEYGLQKGMEYFGKDEESAEKLSRWVVQGGATTVYGGIVVYCAATGAVFTGWPMLVLGGYVIGRALDIPIDYAFDRYYQPYKQGVRDKQLELYEIYITAIKQSYKENSAFQEGNNDDLYQDGNIKGRDLVVQLLQQNFQIEELRNKLNATIDQKFKVIHMAPIDPYFKV